MGNILKLEYEDPRTHVKSTGRIEIRHQAGQRAELSFYGDICSSTWDVWQQEDRCPQNVADFLNALDGAQDISVYINSGGGDSFAGLAIYNILKRSTGKKDVHVDALAASAASVIAMVGCLPGNTLHMPPGAQLMIHDAWTIALGNANDFDQVAKALRGCDASYTEIYTASALEGATAEQFKAMQDAETWLTGEQAAQYFKNVDTAGVQIAASVNSMFFSRYRNVPESWKKPAPAPAAEPNTEQKASALARARAVLALSR